MTTPDPKSNFQAASAFVTFGLEEKRAGRRESASGPGSSLAAAHPTIELLRRTLTGRNITSILDLGCGDWHWMRTLGLPQLNQGLDVRYMGWEANRELVDYLRVTFGQAGYVEFCLKDITTSHLPNVDLIIARDVLFHLPRALSERLVRRIKSSCKFFLATSFLGEPNNGDIQAYLPIDNWGFYPINLNAPPYDLGGDMEEAVREALCSYRGKNRYACLYAFQT